MVSVSFQTKTSARGTNNKSYGGLLKLSVYPKNIQVLLYQENIDLMCFGQHSMDTEELQAFAKAAKSGVEIKICAGAPSLAFGFCVVACIFIICFLVCNFV